MTYTLLYSYLIGWLITSIGLALTVRKLNDPVAPQSHRIPLIVAAGATWPVVVLGAAQLAAIALIMNVARSRSSRDQTIHEHDSAFTDDELNALLEEWPNAAGADEHCRIGQ